MFEFFFKYPVDVFAKGNLVFLSSFSPWLLAAGALAVSGLLAWSFWRRRSKLLIPFRYKRAATVWILQSALLCLLLLLLWQPAISVTTLKPQQNIVAVVVDDSRSMGLKDGDRIREQQAVELLNANLLPELKKRFQIRLYRMDSGLQRLEQTGQLRAEGGSTQIGKSMKQLAEEADTLPVGAVVLLSDGSDTFGGIDAATISELRRRRLPVNTIGFGKERISNDVEVERLDIPGRALSGSRAEAQVTIRQNGFSGSHAHLTLKAGETVLASRDVLLKGAAEQIEPLEFNAGKSGVRNVEVRLSPLPGEANTENNRLTRVLSVDETKRRILYIEGEPRWEYKFLRRAADDDGVLQIVSMLRTTQNKIYRQGIANPNELADGFPTKAEELFGYQALIIGSVESAFFTASQQQLIKDFVDRRGGGVLFLAGRYSLSDGGYNVAPFSELLPVNLPPKRTTFQRNFVAAELTEAGRQSPICRIEDDRAKSLEHWDVLPYLANFQDPGTPKPGAVVLANVSANGKRVPLLITENYGRGRTAVFATAGSWRWRMQQPVADVSQETFWRQLLRWTSGATPSQLIASTPTPDLEDDGRLQIRAEVRDSHYLPASDAEVEAHVIKPNGSSEAVTLATDPSAPGVYSAEWTAQAQGSYVAEVSAHRGAERMGSDVLTFRREDGTAENFHREQNRSLLEKLAEETGGRYYTPEQAKRLPGEIAYSEAGITSREIKDLWNMPIVFLLLLAVLSAQWWVRRRWGVI